MTDISHTQGGSSLAAGQPRADAPPEQFSVPAGEYPPPPAGHAGRPAVERPAGRRAQDIDHVDLRVADLEHSSGFYMAALAPLGWKRRPVEIDPAGAQEVGFERSDGTTFSIHAPATSPGQDTVTTGAHIAFGAGSREAVHEFHAAALAHGGRDIGAPGPRSVYSHGYYGAFVLDPQGNNIEAVWHDPDPSA